MLSKKHLRLTVSSYGLALTTKHPVSSYGSCYLDVTSPLPSRIKTVTGTAFLIHCWIAWSSQNVWHIVGPQFFWVNKWIRRVLHIKGQIQKTWIVIPNILLVFVLDKWLLRATLPFSGNAKRRPNTELKGSISPMPKTICIFFILNFHSNAYACI